MMRVFRVILLIYFCNTSNVFAVDSKILNNWNSQLPEANAFRLAKKYEKALDIYLSLEKDLDNLKITQKARFDFYYTIQFCYDRLKNPNSPQYIETVKNRILYLNKAYNYLKKTEISSKFPSLKDKEFLLLLSLSQEHIVLFKRGLEAKNLKLAEKNALKVLDLPQIKKEENENHEKTALLNMVQIYQYKEDYKKAVKYSRKLSTYCKKNIKKNESECYYEESGLASSLKRSGVMKNIMEAKRIYEEIINGEKTYPNPEWLKRESATNRLELANIYLHDLNDVNTAEKYILEALDFIKLNKKNYINKLTYYDQLLSIYRFLSIYRNVDQGLTAIKNTSKILEELKEMNAPHDYLRNGYVHLADMYGRGYQGERGVKTALKLLLEAKKSYEKNFGEDASYLASRIGSSYAALGDFVKAEKFYQASIVGGKNYLIKYRKLMRLARVQMQLNKNQKAKGNFKKAEKLLTNFIANHSAHLSLYIEYIKLYSPDRLDDSAKFNKYLIESYKYVSDYSKGLIQKKYGTKTTSKELGIFPGESKEYINVILAGILSDDRFIETSDVFELKTDKTIENVIIELTEINKGAKINESVQNAIDRSENPLVAKDKKELQTLIIKYEKSKKISDNIKEQKKIFQNLKSIKKEISDKKEIILSKLNLSTVSSYSREIDIQDIQNLLSNAQAIVSYNANIISIITSNNIYFEKVDLSTGTIGVGISQDKNNMLFFASVAEGSPAFKAGIKKRDYLLEVNGEKIVGKGMSDVVDLIRGPAGKPVEITIQRNKIEKTKTFQITRANAQTYSTRADVYGRVDINFLLASLISNVRTSLKVNSMGEIPDFNNKKSKELYKALISPIKSFIKDKKELMIIPNGSLLSMPFEILIDPEDKKTKDKDYKNINWLGKKYAISYYPSIYSFYNLKKIKFKKVKNDFIGFGDPILVAENKPREISYGKLFYRGIANPEEIRNMEELPETADELKSIAKIFKDGSKLYLREDFNEEVVKTIDLNNYKIISFATHAVISNEINNIAEPGLILTPPDKPTEINDGILTVSEVERLNLQSDIVILSACNTAAADGSPNAGGLSGLASAFFQAGTKSILVTHWDVETNSAVKLTTGMFDKMKKTKNLSQALHLSKMDILNNEETSHPFFWAPYVLIGNVTQAIN